MKIDTAEKYQRRMVKRTRLKKRRQPYREFRIGEGMKPNHKLRAVPLTDVYPILRDQNPPQEGVVDLNPAEHETALMALRKSELQRLMDEKGYPYNSKTTKTSMVHTLLAFEEVD